MEKSNNRSSIRLNIKNNFGQNIVGILERKSNDTFGAKLGIICHGIFGHKNYLFQEKLSKGLPFDNFRFDFRGNGESDGVTRYSNFREEAEDIDTVVKYLESEFGYKLYAAIGHSKGSIAVLIYACYINRHVPHVINLSVRYNIPETPLILKESELDLLEKQGYIYQTAKVRGRVIKIKFTYEDFNYDMSFVRKIPETTSVLICHGMADERVPVKDAAFFANLIPNHTLELLPETDHSYSNHETLIKAINKYFSNDFQYVKFHDRHSYINGIPRYLFVDGVRNFRDLGGYECNLEGGPNNGVRNFVRERFVFRCGNLVTITDDGIATLRKLNIQKIFDLRSNPELNKAGIRNIEGITRVHAPVFKEEDYSPEKLFERWNLYVNGTGGYSQAYMVILEEGKRAYREIFKHILERPTQPFIVHCTAGKDRTGVFAMLLLKLLGVSDEIVSREYELTRIDTKDVQKTKSIIETAENQFSKDELKEMLSARYESMILFLQNFKGHYKTVSNYLLQCGLTKEEIEIIKNNLMLSNSTQSFNSLRSSL